MGAKKVESGLVSAVEHSPSVPATRRNIALEPTPQVNLGAAAQRDGSAGDLTSSTGSGR
jgi:hypothetical protein